MKGQKKLHPQEIAELTNISNDISKLSCSGLYLKNNKNGCVMYTHTQLMLNNILSKTKYLEQIETVFPAKIILPEGGSIHAVGLMSDLGYCYFLCKESNSIQKIPMNSLMVPLKE